MIVTNRHRMAQAPCSPAASSPCADVRSCGVANGERWVIVRMRGSIVVNLGVPNVG